MSSFKRVIDKVIHPSAFLPPELLFTTPVITITRGQQILIEQHYKLLHFSEDEIILQFKTGNMKLIGEEFFIKMMYENEIVLEGNVKQITFDE